MDEIDLAPPSKSVKPLSAAERMRRYRARQRNVTTVTEEGLRNAENVTLRYVTVTLKNEISQLLEELRKLREEIVTLRRNERNVTLRPLNGPSPKNNINPYPLNPPKEDSPPLPLGVPTPRKKPAHAIVTGWRPDEQDLAYARSKGRDERWIDEQAEMFRDHHLKTGQMFCDWHACWRTWVQRSASYGSNSKGNGNGTRGLQKTAATERFDRGTRVLVENILRRESEGRD